MLRMLLRRLKRRDDLKEYYKFQIMQRDFSEISDKYNAFHNQGLAFRNIQELCSKQGNQKITHCEPPRFGF
jgi:hypothetical protein